MLYALSAGQKTGLGLVAAGFVAFALLSAFVIPKYRPDYPGRGLRLFIGVTVLFTVHVFVNIAMTIGLVPITGIPLPFISYGGSFVLSCCLLQGLVQSVWRFRKDFT